MYKRIQKSREDTWEEYKTSKRAKHIKRGSGDSGRGKRTGIERKGTSQKKKKGGGR